MDWRRSKVLELSSQGNSEREIASELQVSRSTIHKDITHLNKQARQNLQHHLSEVVPQEFQRCMAGIKSNLKQTLEIADTVSDPRVKLQARSIANECYHSIIDLSTNAGVISESLHYMEKRKEQIDNLQKAADKAENVSQTLREQGEITETETDSAGVF